MIDYVLAVCLILLLPGRALWKSLRKEQLPPNRPKAYLKTGSLIAGLLILLGYDWWHHARSLAALGLDVPLSRGGAVGFVIVAIILIAATIFVLVRRFRGAPQKDLSGQAKVSANESIPRSRAELAGFMVLAVLIGVGWEVLYRGFLLWLLVPHAGIVAAICIAAFSYAAAHGYKSRKQFVASIVSAFLFTIAFALSGSLWWLMLIHTTLGLVGGILGYKVASRKLR
ncbi:MAG TPA: CPBP family intramembrane glutamic endopeptidase [Rudaea sp.]|nr:CPBP family intramembrane glutamic endopeptidase [Rudaea sp.]